MVPASARSSSAIWCAFVMLSLATFGISCGNVEHKPVELSSLRMYVPVPELPDRVGSDVEPLTTYIKALEKAASQFVQREKKPAAKGLLIAVGIAADKKTRIWCDAVEGDCPSDFLRNLEKLLAGVESIHLKRPPMAFGMEIALWGQKPKEFPQFPESWLAAARRSETKRLIPPDDIFKTLWPEAMRALTNTVEATNFVLQILEPTGGKVQRPKDWFYAESHSGPSYVWTISREESLHTPYTTGMRIQMLTGIKEHTGKSPKTFVQDFIKQKKKQADKVVNHCSENKQQFFTRVCLETYEGPHHILYSLFWGNDDLDIAVIAIAGTTRELWNRYSAIFDRMNGFELIDMKRFEK